MDLSGGYTSLFLFFFNDTATTEIYTLSLHDALPIFLRDLDPPHRQRSAGQHEADRARAAVEVPHRLVAGDDGRHVHHRQIGEHTSELQSRQYLVCRLLLEKKTPGHIPLHRLVRPNRT